MVRHGFYVTPRSQNCIQDTDLVERKDKRVREMAFSRLPSWAVLRSGSRSRRRTSGFSLLEIIVVFSIISIMIGVGAASYRGLIDTNSVASASSMLAAHIRQARQFAVALRESRRVVILIERVAGKDIAKDDPLIDLENPPLQIWMEAKRTQSKPYSEAGNAYQISDSQKLSKGVTVASVSMAGQGVYDPGELTFSDHPSASSSTSEAVRIFVEFNSRGQLAGVYCDNGSIVEGNKDSSITGGQVFLHFLLWGQRIALTSGAEEYYSELVSRGGNQLGSLERDSVERFKAHTVEILRLTGRVREYDYGYGRPWDVAKMDPAEA